MRAYSFAARVLMVAGQWTVAGVFLFAYYLAIRFAFWLSPAIGWPVALVLGIAGAATFASTFADTISILMTGEMRRVR